MRTFSKVFGSYWSGPTGREIRAAGEDAQLLGLYLLTNADANMLGLYYLPVALLCHQVSFEPSPQKGLRRGSEGASKGLPRAFQRAKKALGRLFQAGFCAYDEGSEYVWVYEMGRLQVLEDGQGSLKPTDKRVKHLNKLFQSLSFNPFLVDFHRHYAEMFHLEPPRQTAPIQRPLLSPFEAPSKGFRGWWTMPGSPFEARSRSRSRSRSRKEISPL